jgi:hypothetical protein
MAYGMAAAEEGGESSNGIGGWLKIEEIIARLSGISASAKRKAFAAETWRCRWLQHQPEIQPLATMAPVEKYGWR